jgi:hypothetical protein
MKEDLITSDQWFDEEEFNDFSNQMNEEVSVQTRMKLALIARRTAKRRAFLTKIRAKKRKGLPQLRKRARNQVKAELKRRLGGSNWSKMSYGQRKRLDDLISKKRKFVDSVVKQVMPKVYKGESERLKKAAGRRVNESILTEEKTKSEIRASATDRKRRQRARESELRQIDPAKLAFVVRDTTNNRIMIVDKNSYEKEKHAILVKPENMTLEVAKQYSQDPSFKNTVTSQRILGEKISKEQEVASAQKPAEKKSETKSEQMPIPTASVPMQDMTKVDYSSATWSPIVALNLIKGIDVPTQVKNKMISPDQAEMFNTSENIQSFASKVASDFAESFFRTTGRQINEYEIQIIDKAPVQTSKTFQALGVYQAVPTTDILMVHSCSVGKSNGCEAVGVDPSEQVVKISTKFGRTNVYTGKLNRETKAAFSIAYQTLKSIFDESLTSFENGEISFNESDKESIEIFKKKLDLFFKEMEKAGMQYSNDYDNSVFMSGKSTDIKKKLDDVIGKLNSSKNSCDKILQELFSTSRIFLKIFFTELLTGQIKFDNSQYAASHILAINPDSGDVKFEKLDESIIDQMLDTEEVKLNIGVQSSICNTECENYAFNKTIQMYQEASKEIPQFDNPVIFCNRFSKPTTQVKENYFKNCSLRVLFEQDSYLMNQTYQQVEKQPTPAQKTVMSDNAYSMTETDPVELEKKIFEYQYYRNYMKHLYMKIKSAKTSSDKLMTSISLFNSIPEILDMTPIDFYNVMEEKMGAKVTPIVVNGKQRIIKVINTPVFDYNNLETIDNPMESYYSIAKEFLAERKARNYKREYETYHGTAKQKKDRAARNLARAIAKRKGLVRKGDGKDIDHKDRNPRNNSPSNLRVRSKSENRADHR